MLVNRQLVEARGTEQVVKLVCPRLNVHSRKYMYTDKNWITGEIKSAYNKDTAFNHPRPSVVAPG